MQPDDASKQPAIKKTPLIGALNKNEKIKKTVTKAATDLTEVNETLKKEEVPVETVKEAITQNEEVEQNVTEAATGLKRVNTMLSRELAGRRVVESKLVEAKADLADVRNELSKSQVEVEQAEQLSLTDALTGLPNRLSFAQRIEHGLSQARRHNWGLAVLFIDLDGFKGINDSHGHDLGDQVLQTVANRLKSLVRNEDMVSRWGGDEFVCLLLDIKTDSDVVRLAEKMISRIAEPCDFDGKTFNLNASIGIALYPEDGETADGLLRNADSAMYKAKGTENRINLFQESGMPKQE